MNLVNLDFARELMLQEFEADIENGNLNYSKRFNSEGTKNYPEVMRDTIINGDGTSLAHALIPAYFLTEEPYTRNGVTRTKKVPHTANETFAEGEFNRYYIRGCCLYAISQHLELEVYRAKEVSHARSASIEMIGSRFDADTLLNDIRNSPGVDTALGLPPGPNSGLSVKII